MIDVATRTADADHRAARSRSSSSRPGCPTARRSPRSAAGCPQNGYRNDIWLFAADGKRGDAERRPQPLGPARHHAGLRDEQRHHARRRLAAHSVGRRRVAVVPRPEGRRLPALADLDGRRRARAADRGPALPLVVRPGRAAGRTRQDRVHPLRADRAGRRLGPRRPRAASFAGSRRSTRRHWPTSSWPSRRSATSRSTGATSRAGSCPGDRRPERARERPCRS